MIWHNRKINGPVTAGDWNDDQHMVDREALLEFLGREALLEFLGREALLEFLGREALLEFLGISSGGGGGDGGGGGSGQWVLLDDLEFQSPVQSFTLATDGYDFLRIEYAVIVTDPSNIADQHFAIYPNGDTDRENYSSFMHYTTSGGTHNHLSNWPSPYPLFAMEISSNVQCVNIGNILISLKNGIRRLFVNENSRIDNKNYVSRGEHIARWTNTSSDVTSLNISSQNCVLTGKVAVYGW
ncbi:MULTISPECIES: hypothetical protein [Methanothermobacter]|uniref:Uncharacterized protein n=1 Tax=Methanothermobacter wolfeii TaxID=145261 RepID=A0A9E7RSE7_METWO|nr:hypothetical protein [Methanothermobacter wolfeii]NP_071836.1 hypothetical protein psiM100p35 [Methanothermobacter phage psiM100]AAG39975.1 unknown [Methanothermobacter phage psiM100]UXH31495.1 hypothetical protein N5910_08110 [Methanothermobacter wolfeii]